MLVLPIDLLAAWTYYKQGYVDVKVAALVCLGFIIGGWFGAKIGTSLPNAVLTKIFALLLIVSAVRVLFINSGDSV